LASSRAFDPATPAEIPSDTDAPSPLGGTQESDAEPEDGDTFKLILRSTITKDITLTVRPTTTCGAIVKAFLKKAGVADQYPTLFGAYSGAKAGDKGGRKSVGGQKGKAPEKEPALSVDGDRMGNDVKISEADLDGGDLVDVVGL
jgi:hypothetical protein